ncbi:MAG TPA: Crp/Fnr family transcriptional regulator [Bradyrhizobium sp.]|nr:Crp/Fnr family transcriptional regulator [Bradyrhizobium sp.]
MSAHDAHQGAPFDLHAFLNRPSSGVTLERYERDQRVFVQGDPADTVGYVRKGAVKAKTISDNGREAIVGIFRQGLFFGETALGARIRTTTIVALEESLITSITRERMLSVLSSEPAFCELFLTHLLSRNDRLEGDLIDQLLHSSEQRLARVLLLLAELDHERDKPIPVPLSQETLAEMIGTTRSRVSTFMNRFRDRGFIDYDSSGRILVNAGLLLSVLGS